MTYVGLSIYGAFISFRSLVAVNAFAFGSNLVVGICIAICVAIFTQKSSKAALGISGLLIIGINLLLAARHEFRHFAEAIRGFYSINGLLIGISVSISVCMWMVKRHSMNDRRAR